MHYINHYSKKNRCMGKHLTKYNLPETLNILNFINILKIDYAKQKMKIKGLKWKENCIKKYDGGK